MDFKIRFELIFILGIPQWIIDLYGDIEESDVVVQDKLIRISTNGELKVPQISAALASGRHMCYLSCILEISQESC